MTGGRWRIAARVDHPDPAEANRLALADLEGGADTLTVVAAGAPGAHGFGIDLSNAGAFDTVLEGVALDLIETRLDSGAADLDEADRLVALLDRRGHGLEALRLDLGLDPVGALAGTGALSDDWPKLARRLSQTALRLAERGFDGPVLRADGRLWHAAGASAAQELGAVLGSGLVYLRALEAGGVPLGRARAAVSFALAADTDLVRTVAKFRALRRLWASLEASCGLEPARIRLHGETAWRHMSAISPHTNIVRGAVACFAAAVGGADGITVLPYTLPLGLPDAEARRLARNTQHVLAEESHLGRVTDPATGAPAFEAATESLCEDAWSELRQLEREGGIVDSLRAGRPQERVAKSRSTCEGSLVEGTAAMVGVNRFEDEAEVAVTVLRRAPASTADPPLMDQLLRAHRLSERFELGRAVA